MKTTKLIILVLMINCLLTGCVDKSVYVGDLKDGKRHGQGTVTWSDGSKYEGEFKNGEPIGTGSITFPNGDKYVRKSKDGKQNGQGTFSLPDGYWKNQWIWANERIPGDNELVKKQSKLFKNKEYEKGTQIREEILKRRIDILGEYSIPSLYYMRMVADGYRRSHKPGKSIKLLKKTINLSEERFGKYHFQTYTALYDIIGSFYQVWRYDAALPYSKKNAEIAKYLWPGKNKRSLKAQMQYLRNLVYKNEKDPILENLLIENQNMHINTLGSENEQAISSKFNLADYYYRTGSYEKAAIIQKDIIINTDNKKQLNRSKRYLAKSYISLAKYDQARPLIEEALIFDKNTTKELTDLLYLSIINILENKKKDAQFNIDRVLELGRNKIDEIIWSSGKDSRYSYIKGIQNAVNVISFVSYKLKDPKSFLQKSILFKELSTRSAKRMIAISQGSNDPELMDIVKNISNYNKIISEKSSSNSENIESEIKVIKSKIEDLEVELAEKTKRFHKNQNIQPKDLVKKLEENDFLIDFTVFNKNLEKGNDGDIPLSKGVNTLIAVIVNSKYKNNYKFVDLGPYDDIKNIIKDLREEISEPESYAEEDIKETAYSAYEKIWEPLDKHLEGARRIYIVPDGILHLLPFKALVDEEGQYLVETSNLINITSVYDLFLPKTTTSKQDSVVFSAPLYDPTQKESYAVIEKEKKRTSGKRSGDLFFTPLPGTLEEGTKIKNIFSEKNKNVTFFKFEESSEKNLYKLNSPKILHLATHGFFLEIEEDDSNDATNPLNDPLLRSGLAFTNANLGVKGEKQDDGSDGVLTSMEALGLQLNGTDLVVLSACETGVGEIRQGEGVNGLRGSFIQAGAKSVLSTLWEISDEGTKQFMTSFYPPIIEGENPQSSLRKVQREFISSDVWSHPFSGHHL